jgi:hypothetical protein
MIGVLDSVGFSQLPAVMRSVAFVLMVDVLVAGVVCQVEVCH